MPTYEYECSSCEHRFERFQSMLDRPIQRCPKCRCKVRRILGTGSGIIFKGSGFYETDYRRKGAKDAAKTETPSAETAPKKESSSDSTTKKESSGDSASKAKPKEK